MGLKRFCIIAPVLFFIFSCTDQSDFSKDLAKAESYMESSPDSALALLRSVDVPASVKDRAKLSLLHSMALDKCYIDLKTDSILAPAVNYYSGRGPADDRLKMCYYRARLSENAGDLEDALSWLVQAETYVPRCHDYSAVGRMYTSKATQYYNSFLFEEADRNDRLALEYYTRADDCKRQIVALLDLAVVNIPLKRFDQVDSVLNVLDSRTPEMTPLHLKRFSRYKLLYALRVKEGIKESLQGIYEHFPSPSSYPNLEMARAYNYLACPDSSFLYLSKYREKSLPTRMTDHTYYLAMSDAYALNGDYEEAFKNERVFISYEMNDLYERLQSEINFVEQREKAEYASRTETLKARFFIVLLVLISLSLGLAVLLLHRHLQRKNDEARRVNGMLDALLQEKETLSSMAGNPMCLSPEMADLLNDRIARLESVLVMVKTGSHVRKDVAMAKLDEMVRDQKSFLTTLSFLYSVRNPEQISYLKSRHLTDTELGYCCLYMMGLNTKEVISLLDTTNAYNTNSAIRKKLGVTDPETSLSDYLRGQYL